MKDKNKQVSAAGLSTAAIIQLKTMGFDVIPVKTKKKGAANGRR